MCTPLLLGLAGLAVSGAGIAMSASAQHEATDAQIGVQKRALKLNGESADKNRTLLMGEAKQQAPAAQTAGDAAAASQAQQAMSTRTNDALNLFQGSRTGGGAANGRAVAGQVQAETQPRMQALSIIQGNAEGNRRRLQLADRTNEDIDANTSATGRMLGLLPMQMDAAGRAGSGLALGGQLAGAVGGGLTQQSIWSKPAPSNGGRIAPTAGATDIRNPYADPYHAQV